MGRWIGVIPVERSGRFLGSIRRSGRQHYLGSWPTARLAAVAHDRAALFFDIRDEKLNFPERSRRLGPADAKTLKTLAWVEYKRLTKSRFRGVEPRRQRWGVHIRYRGETRRLGPFDTEEEAALAYDREARRIARTSRTRAHL